MSKLLKSSLNQAKVFVVDDEDLIAWSIETELQKFGAQVSRVANVRDAIVQFPRFHPDIVICDLKLPDGNGLDLVKKWRHEYPQVPIILITAHGAIDSAITAIRLGAFDYLQKPFDVKDLLAALKRASEVANLRQKVSVLASQESGRKPIRIVGESEAIEQTRQRLHKIAISKADSVMILGESGTGKELAARAVHEWSIRSELPFVEINCASIPETLLESELFGHEKGSFTDARERKFGLFEIAGEGTVFLDEIGELPAKLQAKLLRVLEGKRFRRIGGVKDISLQARIVVATNRDLRHMVQEGSFRSDLYFRLHILKVQLAPLRDRVADIPILTQFFLNQLSNELKITKPQVASDAMQRLEGYSWPGNARELRNVLQRALILHEPKVIKASLLELDFEEQQPPRDTKPASSRMEKTQANLRAGASYEATGGGQGEAFVLPEAGLSLDTLEKNLLTQALERARYNQTKAANLLGISRHTLRYRLEKYDLQG